ncbi:MAG TPA: choice-of-anchor D domain-containing protein [Acidobacteriaceae bacterium]|nr:choice-of-anchor D domain-containing protein [Acidobacteriaceae bacterium]
MILRRALPLLLCALVAILVTGCGATPNLSHPTPVGGQRSGIVHGGQQPVAGASIQLYAVGTTGNGSAATPLLTSTVTSDASGSFTITGLYSCTGATQVYIVATGGNPGVSTANPDIALMAAIGSCSSLASSTFININELTTVAAVATLAPYMQSATNVGASGPDNQLFYDFILANQFVDIATGTSPGASAPSGYIVPTAELNTLADILSACINSTGGTAGDGSLCGQLFSLATVSPNPAPTNTISALINIIDNPTQNVSSLYSLVPPTPPFQPTLTSAPSTFQMALTPPAGGTVLQVTPTSATFPATVVGSSFTSPAESFTLTNNSSQRITVSSVSVTGASGATFNPSQDCGGALDPGGSCSFTVTATPTEVGPDSGTLNINSSVSLTALTVPLSITGLAPGNSTATLSPSSTTFNIWGANADFILANTGSTVLNVGYLGANNTGTQQNGYSYTLSSDNCTAPIPAGSSCTFGLQNQLTAAWSSYQNLPSGVTGQAYVHDDTYADGGFQTARIVTNTGSILLQNNVVNGTVSFPPNQVGYSQTAAIELANVSTQIVGGNPATVVSGSPAASLTIGGANPGDFSVSAVTTSVSPNPSTSCPGGTSVCNITVTFDPTAAGTRTAKLSLDSGGSSTGQYILLTGTAVGSGPSFATSPAASSGLSITSFLPVNTDPKVISNDTVVVTNTGTTTLTLTAVFTGGEPSRFVADVSQCRSVAPQATCTVTVTPSSLLLGSYGATLVLADAASSASATLGVSSRTSNWIPTASLPSVYTFPSQAVNTTSAPVSFTVSDPNGYPIGDPITLSLPANSNFTLPVGTCPAGPQVCTLSVAFSPHTTGAIQENLLITDSVTGASSMVTLKGTATP